MSKLIIENLTVNHPGALSPAVDDLTLTVEEATVCVLLGPSGCGKSTTLNAIAGLASPVGQSRITVGDRVLFDHAERINLPPNSRNVGVVFQSYALWPHMTVRQNIEYPLKRAKTPKQERSRRVDDLLELVRCGPLANRFPAQLSGGQQQRVALARALAPNPPLVLFDEPLSNLDAELRKSLRSELALLQRELGFTGVYVTHDQEEAFGIATELAVMSGGHIAQRGQPQNVFEAPATADLARFFGANVWMAAADGGLVETAVGRIPQRGELAGITDKFEVAVYPDRIIATPSDTGALVRYCRFLGGKWEILVQADNGDIVQIHRPAHENVQLQAGSRVTLSSRDEDVHVYPIS